MKEIRFEELLGLWRVWFMEFSLYYGFIPVFSEEIVWFLILAYFSPPKT
jgi:hypothetical protein